MDGNGLSAIEDPELAQRFVKTVNDMNVVTGLQTTAAAAAFAALPQSVVGPAAWSVLLCTVLYLVRDKIPTPYENNNGGGDREAATKDEM